MTRRRRTPRRRIRAGCRDISSAVERVDRRACRHARRREAARIIFRFGLWPAALELWGIGRTIRGRGNGTRRVDRRQAHVAGLAAAAAGGARREAHARNGVTGAMAHGFSRWAWSSATLRHRRRRLDGRDRCARGAPRRRRLRRARPSRRQVPADRLQPDRHLLSRPCGTLVRVEIERATGDVRIAKAYSVLECGTALVPEVVRRPDAGRLRDGRRLRAARDPAAVRGRPRQRPVESRPIPGRARLRPAAARPRDRDPAAVERRASRRRAWPRS